MSTVQQDNVIVKFVEPTAYPIKTDGTADINGGDLVYFDTSAKVIKSLDSDAHAAQFAGLAMNGSYIQPYNTKQYGAGMIPVLQKGRVRVNSTSGDTYSHADALYMTADAQTVTNTVGGNSNIVGYVFLAPGIASLAGGAGITLQMDLAVKFPTTAFS